MTYRVDFTSAAARQVKKLPYTARDRVLDASEDPGEETAWRIGVGDYRVIYDVLDAELIVTGGHDV